MSPQKKEQCLRGEAVHRVEVLIIGSGIAALSLAVRLSNRAVLLVCKRTAEECNTFYAQGGIAFSLDEEDQQAHVRDTLDAGAGLCDEQAVRFLCAQSSWVMRELLELGCPLDRRADGGLKLTQEGAHSRARIAHADGDGTGRVVHRFLRSLLRSPLLEGASVTDLILEGKRARGAVCEVNGERTVILADAVVIASGGLGSLYQYNTNSRTASGELHGIALEHGMELQHMEMTQFHPTAYVESNYARKFLLSEALRGEGAEVVDEKGEPFLYCSDPRGGLAPRDVISRAIFAHQLQGHRCFLSLHRFRRTPFLERFPNISEQLLALGFSIPEDLIPISPAYHYAMGGVKTDLAGRVLGYERLFCLGEAACTGVHGANRLASNSLLEALVFAREVAQQMGAITSQAHRPLPPLASANILECQGDEEVKAELRRLMWEKVGIIRTLGGLKEARERVLGWREQKCGRMLSLRLSAASAIIDAALARPHSLGAHFIQTGMASG